MIGTIREPVPGGTSGKEPVCQCKIRQRLELRFSPWGREDPLEEGMATHSSIIFLENPHGQRSLVGYSPWGHKRIRHDQSDLTCTHQGAGGDRGNGPPPQHLWDRSQGPSGSANNPQQKVVPGPTHHSCF